MLFIAVGESVGSRSLLKRLQQHLKSWPRPILNLPEKTLALSRDGASAVLQSIPGVYMPLTARVHREKLLTIANQLCDITEVLADGKFFHNYSTR